MDRINTVISESVSLWTRDYNEKKVISILSTWKSGKTKSREQYHWHAKYAIISLAGIAKKNSQKRLSCYGDKRDCFVYCARHSRIKWA